MRLIYTIAIVASILFTASSFAAQIGMDVDEGDCQIDEFVPGLSENGGPIPSDIDAEFMVFPLSCELLNELPYELVKRIADYLDMDDIQALAKAMPEYMPILAINYYHKKFKRDFGVVRNKAVAATLKHARRRSPTAKSEQAQYLRMQARVLKTNIRHMIAKHAPIRQCGKNISRRYFEAAKFAGIDLSRCYFSHTNCKRADFSGSMLAHALFRDADATGASFAGACVSSVVFCDAIADGANFSHADARNARFTRASLRGACFVGAMIDFADFTDADTTDADFTDAFYVEKIGDKLFMIILDAHRNIASQREIEAPIAPQS